MQLTPKLVTHFRRGLEAPGNRSLQKGIYEMKKKDIFLDYKSLIKSPIRFFDLRFTLYEK